MVLKLDDLEELCETIAPKGPHPMWHALNHKESQMSDLLTEVDREYQEALERENKRMQALNKPPIAKWLGFKGATSAQIEEEVTRQMIAAWNGMEKQRPLPLRHPKPRRPIANRELRKGQ
jgi:hypothetical protein